MYLLPLPAHYDSSKPPDADLPVSIDIEIRKISHVDMDLGVVTIDFEVILLLNFNFNPEINCYLLFALVFREKH